MNDVAVWVDDHAIAANDNRDLGPDTLSVVWRVALDEGVLRPIAISELDGATATVRRTSVDSRACEDTAAHHWQGGGVEPIDTDTFEELVAEALESIPDELRAEMENVAIIIDDESPPGRLYGLYEGIPLTKRGTYGGANPDRITLFLATICQSANTLEELSRRVRVTVLHEVGHHFGIGEARLHELGWA